ncbi:hypothetical protein [Halalkalibacterium ligniniphilum]|uniref:hypothetical protein n=1 Tax=Halalkalibacterium ligniniphilum TaxID=1134413 RepID=UPI00034C68EE|nr:hypothetical protein [Halalkalibacterium ligniniphilum]
MRQGNLYIREYLEDVISIKWLAIGVVFYFYGFMLKKEVFKSAYEMGISFNNWDITLRLLNDMYLIVYFIIPIVLFISIKSILVDFDYQILIRLGSFKKWVYHSLKHFWLKSIPLLFLWLFVSLFMMIGFPYSWNWSQLSGSNHITNTLYELVKFFELPILVFIAQLILLVLTLSLLHSILATVYVLTKSKHFMILISAMIFLGSIIGFKLLPKEMAFLSPTTYFSITKAVNSFNSPISSYIVVLVFGLLSVLYLRIIDLNKKMYVQSIKSYIPIGIYLILCLIGIISTANSLKPFESTIWDVWVMSFRGSNAENFAYLPFFFYLIVFFGFIYLVQLFLSNEIEQLGYYKIIRYKNLNKWFWSWMRKLLIVVILFLFVLMAFALLIAVYFGMNTDFYATVLPNSLYEVIYHFFINGFLQVVFYIFAVFIVSWLSKESIHGVLLISLLMVLMLPGINSVGIIPVGLNSIVYLTNFSPYYLTFILIIMNTLALGVINYLFKRSLKI